MRRHADPKIAIPEGYSSRHACGDKLLPSGFQDRIVPSAFLDTCEDDLNGLSSPFYSLSPRQGLRGDLRRFAHAALPWVADAIGVICLFFILFIGLFLEVIFS
jgi:hypothetical protein